MNNIVTPDSLSTHYNKKYPVDDAPRDAVALRKYPANRSQAAVKWAGTGRRALEIGPGDAEVMFTLRGSFEQWVAADISQRVVDRLAEQYRDDAGVVILHHNIDQQKVPFPDDHFDMVLLLDVIEHLVEPISAMSELRRVMAPGGRLVIDTPNIAKWTRRIKLMMGEFPSTASLQEGLTMYDGKTPTDIHDEGHIHYFTFRSLTRLLIERVGFSEVQWHGYGAMGPLCGLWPTMFSDVFLIAVK